MQMNFQWIKKSVALVVLLSFIGCDEPKENKSEPHVTAKELIENNRKTVRVEADQIDKYIQRRGWDMAETGTGLRYMIYDSASNGLALAADEDTAYVNYTVSLINGKDIYQSNQEDPAHFVVGHDDVESGLQEGIRFMKPGDKAMMIIPSHLAHGFTGDFNKIPQSSTVIFDIELVRLQ